MSDTPLTEAEKAAEQVLSNALPQMVGLVNDALARQITAAVAPIIKRETLERFGDRMGTFNPSPFRMSDQDSRPPNSPSISSDNH